MTRGGRWLGVEERAKIDSEVNALIASEPLLAGKDVVTVLRDRAFYAEKMSR